MHFRTRQKIVQLVRTSYDATEKKPKAVVVGRMTLENPQLTSELRAALTDSEVKEAQAWIENQGRLHALREEMAALSLVDNLRLASNWFMRNAESRQASVAVSHVLPALHAFRKTLKDKGFL
jgi:hypothetical protein